MDALHDMARLVARGGVKGDGGHVEGVAGGVEGPVRAGVAKSTPSFLSDWLNGGLFLARATWP